MPKCSECLKTVGKNGFRLSTGCIDYEELSDGTYESVFVPEPFGDGDMFKHLCPACASWHEVHVDELDLDVCMALDKETYRPCAVQLTPAGSPRADQVLRVERGKFESFKKGPLVTRHRFDPGDEARVHYACAVTHWGLTHLCLSTDLADEACQISAR